ncbi:MAG: rRNA maturation RNase YbeY [Erysipelotrichaceae bacterium]
MEINFLNKTKVTSYRSYKSSFSAMMKCTLDYLNLGNDFEIAVIMTKDKKMHQVNLEYRQIDRTTDVISFANIDYTHSLENELGDVFINVDAAKRQAIDYEHSEYRELNFLFLHGLLHCLGYDHMNQEDEKEMIGLQKSIFKMFNDQEI